MALIKEVFSDKDIKKRITSDSAKYDADSLPVGNDYRYIVGFVGNSIIGVNIFCDKGDYVVCHFNVLPRYRFKYAKKFAEKCLKMRSEKALFAITPKCYNEIINFCKNVGFSVVGEHEEPFVLNGISHRQVITRYV